MRLRTILTATVLGAALTAGAAGSAMADPSFCPPGHAKKGWCGRGDDHYRGDRHSDRRWDRHERRHERREDYRERTRERERDAYEEGYRDGREDEWRRGDRIPRSRYEVFDDYEDYGWRDPGPDESYVVVDGRYYLIQAATGLILDALLNK